MTSGSRRGARRVGGEGAWEGDEDGRGGGEAGESDYPDAAREWGFSGWTADEFDIRADGTPANVRTIVAYPPFVFGPAVESYVKRTRYTQSFRPDGQAGCGGYRTSVGFRYVFNR